jgi:hypothetical protein
MIAFFGFWHCLKHPKVLIKVPVLSLRERAVLNHGDVESIASADNKKHESSKGGASPTLTILSTFAGAEGSKTNNTSTSANRTSTPAPQKKRETPLYAWAKHFHVRAIVEDVPVQQALKTYEKKTAAADRLLGLLMHERNTEKSGFVLESINSLREQSSSTGAGTAVDGSVDLSGVGGHRHLSTSERLERLEEMAQGMSKQHAILTEKVVTAESRQLAQQVT